MFALVVPRKGVRINSNVSVGTSATQLAFQNKNRKTISLQNNGAVTVFIGDSTVANTGAARGYSLFAGATFTDNASDGEWWAIGASGTSIVNVLEVT